MNKPGRPATPQCLEEIADRPLATKAIATHIKHCIALENKLLAIDLFSDDADLTPCKNDPVEVQVMKACARELRGGASDPDKYLRLMKDITSNIRGVASGNAKNLSNIMLKLRGDGQATRDEEMSDEDLLAKAKEYGIELEQ